MNYLTKIVHGKLLEDNFSSLSLAWEISPNIPELVKINENNVELLHGEETSYLLIDTPEGDYVFDVEIEHDPVIMSDIAGVVIMSNKDNYIEVQSYDDNGNNYYDRIKINKKNSRYLVYAREKATGRWQYIGGSTLIDATKIGFFIKGEVNSMNKNLLIDRMSFERNTLIGFDNIPKDYYIELYDQEETLKAAKRQTSKERMFLDTKVLDTPLTNYTFKLKNQRQEVILNENVSNIYGGDVFLRDIEFTFFVNGEEIKAGDTLDFGNITSNIQYIDFQIRNDLGITEANKKVTISPMSNFYKGDEIIFVSKLDESGNPVEFKKTITIDYIDPLETIDLKIKLDRNNFTKNIFYQNDFKAKIVIE